MAKALTQVSNPPLQRLESGVKQLLSQPGADVLAILAGSAVGAGATLLGAPVFGAVAAYGAIGVGAWVLGKHVSGEEAQARGEANGRAFLDEQITEMNFQSALDLLGSEEKTALLSKLGPYREQLDQATLLSNLRHALAEQKPYETTLQVIQRLPLKDWARASQHHENIATASQDAKDRSELRATLREEQLGAVVAFLSFMQANTRTVYAGTASASAHSQPDNRTDPQRVREADTLDLHHQRNAATAEQLANWPVALLKHSTNESLHSLEQQTLLARSAYNAAAKACGDSRSPAVAALRKQYHDLDDALRVERVRVQTLCAPHGSKHVRLAEELRTVRATNELRAQARTDASHYQRHTHSGPGPAPAILHDSLSIAPSSLAPLAVLALAGAITPQYPVLSRAVALAALASSALSKPLQSGASMQLAAALSRPSDTQRPHTNQAPAALQLPSVPTPIGLNNRTQVQEQAIFGALERQIAYYMDELDTQQQREFLQLAQTTLKTDMEFAKSIQEAEDNFEHEHWPLLKIKLETAFGNAIDPRKTFFKTAYRSELNPGTWNQHDREFHRTISLWDAAKGNFDWPAGPASFNDQNTQLVDERGNVLPAPFTTQKVVEQIRSLNVGAKRNTAFEQLLKTSRSAITQSHDEHWQLARLDLARRNPETTLPPLNSAEIKQWKKFSLTLGSGARHQASQTRIDLPLFVFGKAPTFYSYFRGRRDGDLQIHFSEQTAISRLKQDIKTKPSANLEWLQRGMSNPDRAKLQEFLLDEEVAPEIEQLNPLARFLYRTFGQVPPNRTDLLFLIDSTPNTSVTALRQAAVTLETQRLREDWNDGFRSTAAATFAGLSAYGSRAATEILELFSLPFAPIGMNGIMQAVMLGSLGYQATNAGIELLKGNRAEAVQAFGDLVDLFVNGKLLDYSAVLGAGRTQALIKAMNPPQIDRNLRIWCAEQTPSYLRPAGTQLHSKADKYGIHTQDGKLYVKIDHDGQTRNAEVVYDKTIKTYRFAGGPPRDYRPPLELNAATGRYRVNPDLENRTLPKHALLRSMLPAELQGAPLSDAQLTQLTQQTLVTRAHLDAYWQGEAAIPIGLVDALVDWKLRDSIDTASKVADLRAAVPTRAQESVIWPVLAAKLNRKLNIYNPDGTIFASYQPHAAITGDSAIDVIRTRSGAYRPKQHSAQFDTVNADSLWRSALHEYERASNSRQFGKHLKENNFESRIMQLKSEVAKDINAARGLLYQALSANKPQDQYASGDPARAYAPTASEAFNTHPDVLRLNAMFPELSTNSATLLWQNYGTASIAPNAKRHELPQPLKNACHQAVESTRVNRALASLSNEQVAVATIDGEKLLCAALTSFPVIDAKVRVYDLAGNVVARYGSNTAPSNIDITRGEQGQYYARDELGDNTPAQRGTNPLCSAVLQAMSDEQRNALGINIYESQKLAEGAVNAYKTGWRRGVAFDQLQDPKQSQRLQEIEMFRSPNINLEGIASDKGIYSIDNKRYIEIEGHAYQVKFDYDYPGQQNQPLIRMVRPGSAQANKPGNRYNHASGWGLPVRWTLADGWRATIPGLPGGNPLRKSAIETVQRVQSVTEGEAEVFLQSFDFPSDGSSLHTQAAMLMHLEQYLQLPSWALQYRRPAADAINPVALPAPGTPNNGAAQASSSQHAGAPQPQTSNLPRGDLDTPRSPSASASRTRVILGDESNPLRNMGASTLRLRPGQTLNQYGMIQSTDRHTLYAVLDSSSAETYEPTMGGLPISYHFRGINKMAPGQVTICYGTLEGATLFAEKKFSDGYVIYRIDATGRPSVSLNENMDLNARHLEAREGYRSGTIEENTRAGNRGELFDSASLFDEVHLPGMVTADMLTLVATSGDW